ncbi:hypothetical protein ES705_19630 [subsurface metagenome]
MNMKSGNEFENKVRAKRQMMDLDEPDDSRIWSGIETRLSFYYQRRRRVLISGLAVAASIVLLISIALFTQINKDSGLLSFSSGEMSEFKKQEKQYKALVNDKKEQIERKDIDQEIIDYYKTDLAILDSLYQYCLKELNENGYNERTVMILLDTYEKRIRIYDRINIENQKLINSKQDESKVLL